MLISSGIIIFDLVIKNDFKRQLHVSFLLETVSFYVFELSIMLVDPLRLYRTLLLNMTMVKYLVVRGSPCKSEGNIISFDWE
jgi:hypothetical protein